MLLFSKGAFKFYCTLYLIFYYCLLLFKFVLHFLFFHTNTYIYYLVFCDTYNCTVHGADLTYISLLVIFHIIMYVTNKNLES